MKLADDGTASTQFDSAVYYIGLDAKRHPFSGSQVFNSWYADFSKVKVIDANTMASVPLGKPILARPGTRWVKIQSDPKTYFVAPDGYVLRWIQDEETAKTLGGNAWNKNIIDVEPTYFTKYQVGEPISAESLETSWPKGSLVKTADETTVWYITATGRRQITSAEAFAANQFQSKFIRTLSVIGWLSLPVETTITGREDALMSDQYL